MSEENKKDLDDDAEKTDDVDAGVDVDEVDKPELKYTDKDIDDIVGKKFAKWQQKKEAEINEAQELAKMNAQEKAEHERDQLETELNELRNAQTKSEMTSTVRNMLKDESISIDETLLNVLVDVDADKTKKNVESFKTTFNDAVEKEVLERIKNPHEKRGVTSSMNKKDILSIKDREIRQQKIKDNMHLFE